MRNLDWSTRVLVLYILSGARGGTTRARYAFSVSVGFQISVWLAGAIEHVKKFAIRDFADVPDSDDLVKGTCAIEHSLHVSDIRDIPTPNILVEGVCVTVLDTRPSGDVRDEICVCVCEC